MFLTRLFEAFSFTLTFRIKGPKVIIDKCCQKQKSFLWDINHTVCEQVGVLCLTMSQKQCRTIWELNRHFIYDMMMSQQGPTLLLSPPFLCPHLEGGRWWRPRSSLFQSLFRASLPLQEHTHQHAPTPSDSHALYFRTDLQAKSLYLFRGVKGSPAGSIYNSCSGKHWLVCLRM